MENMKIDLDSLASVVAQVAAAQREIDLTTGKVTSDIGPQFSAIAGLNEAGVINGRAIKLDHASAQEVLRKYAEHVCCTADLLATEVDAITIKIGREPCWR